MFLRWVAGGVVISQLDHKYTWWWSHGQSWLQNLGQQDSILMSCLAQDWLTVWIYASSCYIYTIKKLSWMFLLLHLQNLDLELLQNFFEIVLMACPIPLQSKCYSSQTLKFMLCNWKICIARDITVYDILLIVSDSRFNKEVLRYVYTRTHTLSADLKSNEHGHICIILQLFSLGGFVIVVPFTNCEPVIFHVLFFGSLCQRGSIYHVKKINKKSRGLFIK